MKMLQRLAVAAAALTALAAPAGDYSDLWYHPEESGWGANVVQQDETAFVTLFVYGPDRQPIWYVASNARVVAYAEPGGLPVFGGTLYRTRGPWHGGPFNPGEVSARAVGHLSLAVLAHDRMRVSYVAEGVSASKELRRQTFAARLPDSSYAGQFIMRIARPGEALRVSAFPAEFYMDFADGAGWMRTVDDLGSICHFRGPYGHTGKLIVFSGTFACSAGPYAEGTFEVTRLEVNGNGLTGYLRKRSGASEEYGRFAATRY